MTLTFQRLGRVLDEMEAEGRLSPHAAAAIRLLMLTGCRRNEILTLRWEDVHLQTQELSLRDSKTGPRTVSLSPEAALVLASLPRLPGNPWVIPGAKPGAPGSPACSGPGAGCAPAQVSTMSASTTSGTATHPAPWRWARACR